MQAAESIASALKNLHQDIEVEIVDIFGTSLMCKFLSTVGNSYDKFVVTLPALWGALFHVVNNRLILWLIRLIVSSQMKGQAVKRMLDKSVPHAIVRVISDFGQVRLVPRIAKSPPPVVTVVTDPVSVHRAWLSPYCALYIVPTNEAQTACIRYGVPKERIRVIGFPIRTKLFCATERFVDTVLSSDRLRILVMGGSSGFGRIYEDVRLLLASNMKVDITVVCGKNIALYKRLSHLAQNNQRSARLHVMGFTDQIPRLMRNSDVLITKAGPTTVYEAVACQLPAIITSHIPGQEEGNANHFVDMGVAVVSGSPGDTVRLIGGFLKDRVTLMGMRNPSLVVRTCQAADRISRVVVDVAQSYVHSSIR